MGLPRFSPYRTHNYVHVCWDVEIQIWVQQYANSQANIEPTVVSPLAQRIIVYKHRWANNEPTLPVLPMSRATLAQRWLQLLAQQCQLRWANGGPTSLCYLGGCLMRCVLFVSPSVVSNHFPRHLILVMGYLRPEL